MRRVVGFALLVFGLAGCTAGPAESSDKAPPVTVSHYESATSAVPPSAVARENKDIVTAALPADADLPGYSRPGGDVPTILKLCPTIVQTLTSEVHESAAWQGEAPGTQAMVYVATVLDPERAPADKLLATLAPPDCPADDGHGTQFGYDRQPYERDGWSGSLNTVLATSTTGGAPYYEAIYLVSKGDALVNVIVDGTIDGSATFNPAVDETAAHYIELVLDRFAA